MRKNLKKYLLTMLATSLSLVVLVGCTSSKNNGKKEGSTENLPIATIKIKDYGNIEAELYPDIAPNTVNNFISLANDGFYNNLTFHRIIEGFMIQGGDPEGTGVGGPGYSIKGEFKSNGFENNLKHEKGVLSMARTNDPNSAGSQFFIMTEDASHLDGQYAAFGKVISGIDVLEKVEKVETDSNDKPKTDVIIESITVDTKGEKYNKPEKSK
ncbi:peptidylprolyl isomerase [Clostridium septicum]|uniref:Peptidyl-prolyl cis-trans isomerase n=2 Tax=Clostridium septicum TaxID=1504 RepID=A0ABY5AXD0_CLOSE|nr:peptidylprolyl isomerase [Clostridium septicum]MDU1314880.1 peptidylprolyl isomerase [Clostridium septicum]UEC21818.1 peptidylprolyl isomerase [Clostridium septicum]USS00130.1 peptidylprolyl isomerase [Clostridium septicum]WLF68676.1 peptidylprolyl isomerase [Clostridium septicum]